MPSGLHDILVSNSHSSLENSMSKIDRSTRFSAFPLYTSPAHKHNVQPLSLLSQEPRTLLPLTPNLVNNLCQLLDSCRISRNRVPLPMIEQYRRIIITHTEQCHRPMNIRIITTNDVACGNIDQILTLIRKDAFHIVIDETKRGPPRKEDGMLNCVSPRKGPNGHARWHLLTLIRRGRPSSSNRRCSSRIMVAASVAPSEYPRTPWWNCQLGTCEPRRSEKTHVYRWILFQYLHHSVQGFADGLFAGQALLTHKSADSVLC